MPLFRLGARRTTRTLSFLSSGIPFFILLASLCALSSLFFAFAFAVFFSFSAPLRLRFFSSSARLHSMASRNSCSFAGKRDSPFSPSSPRGYFTITSRVRHAPIDVVVVVIPRTSSVMISPSLASSSMSACQLLSLPRSTFNRVRRRASCSPP